jgi:hypothetical protein
MKFMARVSNGNGRWKNAKITTILLDDDGEPNAVISDKGLQYSNFDLVADSVDIVGDGYVWDKKTDKFWSRIKYRNGNACM